MCDTSQDDIFTSSQSCGEVIKAINRDTVHKICSGQVVLSLAIAVKELVENAIDAGATRIDVRLKEYGSELIEVSDNGKGVIKDNFQSLTLKHYTSKIREFSDLENVSTLGFRGEALSSLCALSDLVVLTKHASAEHATKIVYDRNGKITRESVGARERGSTVTLENLFSTLPVRRNEFMKNLKREFNKMCQLLYAYCLVSKGIKFSCTNITSKGSRNVVVATEGALTPRENIISVFGPKQISSLIEVDVVPPDEATLSEYNLKFGKDESLPFTFDCLVSSVMHGNGRSSNDRQFYYINSRPCDSPKIAKMVNEIYRQFNVNQYPFVYLNVNSEGCLVDVNVTPDKRQIFMEKEKFLLATLKTSLLEAFKVFPSTYRVQNLDASQLQNSQMTDYFEMNNKSLKRSLTEGNISNKKGSILERFQKRSKTESAKDQVANESLNSSFDTSENESLMECRLTRSKKDRVKIDKLEKFKSRVAYHLLRGSQDESTDDDEDVEPEKPKITKEPIKVEEESAKQIEETNNSTINKDEDSLVIIPSQIEVSLDSPVANLKDRQSVPISCSLEEIRAMSKKNNDQVQNKDESIMVRFRTKIAPDSNKSAEEELEKQISKGDFKRMTVIGQFNFGFIVAQLDNDLFIIDQHATDEKYNFEQLQANTVLENQVLVNPKPLELTAGNESLLMEYEQVFNKNGFSFKIDHNAPCTKKVLLTSIPMSKNIIFGKDDIEEMLFMLKENCSTAIRPSRVRGMFASRACRKSVMIGKPLSKSDMKRLIEHMGEIEQPWNCPHGRPTMRHLINLDLISNDDN